MNDRIRVQARDRLPGGLRPGLAALVAVVAIGAAAACSSTIEVPAINPTPTGQHHPGQVVWNDLVTPDVDAAMKFYGGLFGWTFQAVAQDEFEYVVAKHGPRPIAGFLRPAESRRSAGEWVQYVSVLDVDEAADRVEAAGGVITAEPVDLSYRGRVALAEDFDGAPFALVFSSSGDPAQGVDPPHNDFMWWELWTTDLERAAAFYADVVGYETEIRNTEDGRYLMFLSDGHKRAGSFRIPQANIEPTWLPTVRVADIKATVEKAKMLGGQIVLEPRWDIGDGKVAIVADPTGAAVTVREWYGQR